MATHCSILAWRIPRTEEPGWLQSRGVQRIAHDQSVLAHTAHYTIQLTNIEVYMRRSLKDTPTYNTHFYRLHLSPCFGICNTSKVFT